ncbi:hypothetical protein CIPAW_08G071300 [Carya illinoinensis]|uniref:Uncharacterized protein n=1 Tax=Carya illinoinensis TaxID=32201 RepID=A0A8T1PTD7_CARIL|nr:hypothetical protein CIPAW_08G071300 [Carya illinoinensis]
MVKPPDSQNLSFPPPGTAFDTSRPQSPRHRFHTPVSMRFNFLQIKLKCITKCNFPKLFSCLKKKRREIIKPSNFGITQMRISLTFIKSYNSTLSLLNYCFQEINSTKKYPQIQDK